ncbi:MAG: DUF2157 domain-containing protein [Rhizonema sp. NSF051]|nr:DUF2157 domain-containing protein [Rhizonema sp. NSF051]
MSSPIERSLKIELRLPSSHPQLLEGLETWLRLGLISDTQVRQICQQSLVCQLVLQPVTQPSSEIASATSNPVAALAVDRNPPQASPNLIARMLQSLQAELSVRWLLFLGVFLVVVSSGVLAATQWQRFPAFGQYGVLFAYTLSFWGFSFWAGRQPNLRLTAQTLLIVTLLLMPVNFWAMDSFSLWKNPLDWIAIAIACPTLTAITILLCQNRLFVTNSPLGKLPLINILGLSYLNWGWKLPGFPLIAVYLATVGTTLITVHRYSSRIPLRNADDRRVGLGITLPALVVVYGLAVVLVRAIFVVRIDITQLGLAIGICGWLVTWLAQPRRKLERLESNSTPQLPWEVFGGVLLFIGWLVAVEPSPWQAIAVSGLSLWFFSRRLQEYAAHASLLAIFAISLQMVWLGWRLVPVGLQEWAIAVGTKLTHSQQTPWALLSVALFPYLIFMVAFTERIYRLQKRDLARFSDILTLLSGSFLTTISFVNPTLRSLNLLFSTITLAVIYRRRTNERSTELGKPLIYLTHITGVVTLCSTIDWLLPSLRQEVWACVLLALMVAEWLLSVGSGIWRRSAWHIGLGLAVTSYLLLGENAYHPWNSIIVNSHNWGFTWLITPLTLTGIGSLTAPRNEREVRRGSIFYSTLALLAVQFLTLPFEKIRLIGLGVSPVLMFVNTSYLRNKISAGITVGFGLGFIVALGFRHLSTEGWFVVGAIAILGLWLIRKVLTHQTQELAVLYADVTDKWAIALCGLELVILTLHSLLVYQRIAIPGFLYLTSTVITLAAITARSWREPTNLAFYGIGWCLELLVIEVLGFGERSLIKIAIANIALGLITQLLSDWWQRQHRLERNLSSFHILPLIYGALSVLLRWDTFTAWTGLCSLGVALIAIGVGRRQQELKPLLYLGIAGISISAYELLFYQMSQTSGGAWGDGLIAMAALGTGIIYAYRILSPWLSDYLRLTSQELKAIAHLHWAGSSCLFMATMTAPIAVNRFVGLATSVFLIRYAIFQGRSFQPASERGFVTTDEIWVYLGLLEVTGLLIYCRDTAIGHLFAGPLFPWNAAIACMVAYFLYILPWERWGWSKKPWQRAAYLVPLIILWETRLRVYPVTLAIAAVFYIFLAKMQSNIRFTYISVALMDWALCRWFWDLHLTDTLWYVTLGGLSLLYIAQVDPYLRLPDSKVHRHYLRLLGSSIICGWAIMWNQDTAIIPGIFSLIAIFAGLALRVRAFLYVGTAAFVITSVYQLVIFSLHYPFLKWVVGLLVGIVLISIAANFETRRTQINTLLRNTHDEFQEWQ